MKNFLVLLLMMVLFTQGHLKAEGDDADKDKRTISGHVKDAETGEDLIGATIYIEQIESGTVTNVYGF